ncbi:Hypothetical_protein [Hexamita inflata]|uniref:Hypothetical_protein n=1 Tax=Hexamita inflata TaxID=28002 RepID=A0AA86PDT4_9EUKA|nr:Hypothetical protein HINF_LOCUS24890 [Hexamita inflata]
MNSDMQKAISSSLQKSKERLQTEQMLKQQINSDGSQCRFNEKFTKFCLQQVGCQLSERTDQINYKVIGLAVMKNLYRVLEKLDVQMEEQKIIELKDVVKAMGYCGLNFLQPEVTDQILKQQ